MNEPDTPALLPPICDGCGHRASLHQVDGCRALLLGRGGPSRTCGCAISLREILGARYPHPSTEPAERRNGVPGARRP